MKLNNDLAFFDGGGSVVSSVLLTIETVAGALLSSADVIISVNSVFSVSQIVTNAHVQIVLKKELKYMKYLTHYLSISTSTLLKLKKDLSISTSTKKYVLQCT